MVALKVYVEGGADTPSLRRECREGFARFLERGGFRGRMPRVVPCGSRQKAFDRFRTAVTQGEMALLLVDSEDFVAAGSSPWAHLKNRPGDGFDRPPRVTDDQCHFMVVCMESWFLADKLALASFFGQEFNPRALPQLTDIEAITKSDVYDGLDRATARCKTGYNKGKHSFKILAKLSPEKVKGSSAWAVRFFDSLNTRMNG